MNGIFQLVFSTLLLLQLGTAAYIPFYKHMKRETSIRRSIGEQFLNNYIDQYDSQSKVTKSHTCAYYNYYDKCHQSNDGCGKQTQQCLYNANLRGCYSVWDDEKVILQGCWYASRDQECTPGACVSSVNIKSSPNFKYFCCCFGDNCNTKYQVSNHIPVWP